MRRTRGKAEPTAFGEFLAERLAALDMTNADFARAIGVSAMTISSYINGPDMPASGRWKAIACALGVRYETIAMLVIGIELPPDVPADVRRLAIRLSTMPEMRRRALVAEWNDMLESEHRERNGATLAAQLAG